MTRAKKNLKQRRLYSAEVDRTTGIICDQTIVLTDRDSARDYPDHLRRVLFHDPETGKKLNFLTNDFTLPALTVAQLYRSRWQVELFFKWIKQHLRIKVFFGTSPNAVKTQIWIAISVYLLVAIARKHLGIQRDLYTILQILSVYAFEKALSHKCFREAPTLPKTLIVVTSCQCLTYNRTLVDQGRNLAHVTAHIQKLRPCGVLHGESSHDAMIWARQTMREIADMDIFAEFHYWPLLAISPKFQPHLAVLSS